MTESCWSSKRERVRCPARILERSRIVLLAAEGKPDMEIAERLGISPKKTARWRNRFLDVGLKGLEKDAPRPGRTPSITPALVRLVVEKTTQSKPANATHWSTRSLTAELNISDSSVLRIWRAHELKSHLVETFKVSNDPQFAEKLEAIVGPMITSATGPQRGLRRSTPGNGEVLGLGMERRRHQEWLRFLKLIDEATPQSKALHLICDNYATHKHARVQRWPGAAQTLPRPLHPHRRFLAEQGQALLSRSDPKLILGVETYIDRHNQKPKPFIWTASARDILAKVTRARRALDRLCGLDQEIGV